MIVELLTQHHLEFLSLKRGCRGSSVYTRKKYHNVGNHMHWLIYQGGMGTWRQDIASHRTFSVLQCNIKLPRFGTKSKRFLIYILYFACIVCHHHVFIIIVVSSWAL